MNAIDFIHDFQWSDAPPEVRLRTVLCLLDLIGIACGGATTSLSKIIRDHAAESFGGPYPMLFDGRAASAPGVALSAGMTIDALDGHDGYNLAKGHVGCGVFSATLALAMAVGDVSGEAFLEAITVGYELGSRLGAGLHATVPDYHTSGAWVAVAAAAAGARVMKLNQEATAHALGIAEFYGPRSQMMRCIDHPTMVKDGSGWGAMAGVCGVQLARAGFTGAPAVTIGDPADIWADLGTHWAIMDQYFKPYPVCRWAHAPIQAALELCKTYGITHDQIADVEIATFHEAVRLAIATPKPTEEAQYSTSFPVAVALVQGQICPEDLRDKSLDDPNILRLSLATRMVEDPMANEAFPNKRYAKVTLTTRDDVRYVSPVTEPLWDADAPPTEGELRQKYRQLAQPLLGQKRAMSIEAALRALPQTGQDQLISLITQPINPDTTSFKAS